MAWFWRLNPFEVMALPMDDIELLADQAERIVANMKRD